jgi:hypothetical protein
MEQVLSPSQGQEYLQVIPQEAKSNSSSLDLSEGKKESIDSAKYSADAVLRDKSIGEVITKSISGIFGATVLFGSITNVIKDFRNNKKSPWVFSRILVDFLASGALIGYALGYTLIGIYVGSSIGVLTLIAEIIFKKRCDKKRES